MYRHEVQDETIGLAGTTAKSLSSSYPPYAADLRQEMSRYLARRDLSSVLAEANGWYPSREAGDQYARVVMPAFSENPKNLYWQARAMGDVKLRYQSPHGVTRGDAIIVVKPSYPPAKGTVIVEGPMDALAAAGAGFVGVAMMGLLPPALAIQTALRVAGNTRVLVVSDEGALEAATALWRHFPGAELRTTYPYKDLAEVPREKRAIYLA